MTGRIGVIGYAIREVCYIYHRDKRTAVPVQRLPASRHSVKDCDKARPQGWAAR